MEEKYRLRVIHLQMVTEAIGTKAIVVQEEWSERYRENQESVGSWKQEKACLEE